jgi:NAD(P)H-dependent FMN reductase
MMHQYQNEHTKKWSEKIAAADGYIFVTPEYNHSVSGALKNAIDYLYQEWNNKAAAFVSYGSNGGSRAVEHLRQIMAEVRIADIRTQVMLNLMTDFENYSKFTPNSHHEQKVNELLDELIAWSTAMKTLRTK